MQTNEPKPRPAYRSRRMPIVNGPRPGRNDRCPCGSGRKFKHCCYRDTLRPTTRQIHQAMLDRIEDRRTRRLAALAYSSVIA
jgi:SEC-C motif